MRGLGIVSMAMLVIADLLGVPREDHQEFRAALASPHLMGNIEVHVNGTSGTITSYLNATHVLSDGTVDIANGTYEDEVVRQNGAWMIKKRTLKLINYQNFGSP